jgi:hypothetical protein
MSAAGAGQPPPAASGGQANAPQPNASPIPDLSQSAMVGTSEPSASSAAPDPSSAPGGSTSSAPGNGDKPWYWFGKDYSDYCAKARNSVVDSGSALYGMLCIPDPQSVTHHKPYPDPQVLSDYAYTACGSWSRDTRQCYEIMKLKKVLEDNPAFRAACVKLENAQSSGTGEALGKSLESAPTQYDKDPNDTPFARCVNNLYLYGPDGRPKMAGDLGDRLKRKLDAPKSDDDQQKANDGSLPRNICPPGLGLKPNSKGFGGYTCQPLTWAAPRDMAQAAEHFDYRSREIASEIAGLVAAQDGAAPGSDPVPPCAAAAFATVLSIFKGGEAPAPPGCEPVISSARNEFAYWQRNHFIPGDRGVDEIIDAYRTRPQLSAPLPGMVGLQPQPQAEPRPQAASEPASPPSTSGPQRQAEPHSPAAPEPARPQAADCAAAETHWKSAEEIYALPDVPKSEKLRIYQDHLAHFSSCAFATLAKARLDALEHQP